MADRIVIVGGNAAGMTAASRAKRLDPGLDVTVVEASRFISYSICGLPYYVAGLIPRHEDLISFDPPRLQQERGIRAKTGLRVEEVVPSRRVLNCVEMETGDRVELPFDRLVICTGYLPKRPGIRGLELANVLTVSRLEHGIKVRELARASGNRRVAVVGAGYVGLMMAHGLAGLGLQVFLFDRHPHVFRQVDADVAELVEQELRRHGVHLFLGSPVRRLLGDNGVVEGVEVGRESYPVDFALIDVGIRPNVELAERSRIPLGLSGAVQVDERGQTAMGGVYAAGNCAETIHLVSGKPLFSTLGTTAAKQGRVVGENLAGWRSTFSGTLETSVEKVFDLAVGRTGLTLRQAIQSGFQADAVLVKARDRAGYFPGSDSVSVKLVFEKGTGRLLGGQMVGDDTTAKRIDTLVAALTARLGLDDLAKLDLAYAPPYGTLWDPIQIAANVALRR